MQDDQAIALLNFSGTKKLFKLVESRLEQDKDTLAEFCFEKWTEELWKKKSRPVNPELSVLNKDNKVDATATFQVQDRFTYNLPDVPEGELATDVYKETFKELFVNNGMTLKDAEEKANDLVDNELLVTPLTFIDFNKWLVGHYEGTGKNRTFVDASDEEIALITKAVTLLRCQKASDFSPLSEEELEKLIEIKANVVVKKGFLGRATQYVNSIEQLRSIFSILMPVLSFHPVDFAVSDSSKTKNNRILACAKDIINSAEEEDED